MDKIDVHLQLLGMEIRKSVRDELMIINQKKRNAYDYVVFDLYNNWITVCKKGKPHERAMWELRANVILSTMPVYVRREFKRQITLSVRHEHPTDASMPSRENEARAQLARSVN